MGVKKTLELSVGESVRLRKTLQKIGEELQKEFGYNVLGLGLVGSFASAAPRIDAKSKKIESDVDYIIYSQNHISSLEGERIKNFVDKRLNKERFKPCFGTVPGVFGGRKWINNRSIQSTFLSLDRLSSPWTPSKEAITEITDLFSIPFFGNKKAFEGIKKEAMNKIHNSPKEEKILRIIEKERRTQWEKTKRRWTEQGRGPIMDAKWMEKIKKLEQKSPETFKLRFPRRRKTP